MPEDPPKIKIDWQWYRNEYLKSVHWKQLKKNTLQSQGRICCECGEIKGLQVHHKTYERLGHELPEDLCVLCGACHAKAHGKTEAEMKKGYGRRKG